MTRTLAARPAQFTWPPDFDPNWTPAIPEMATAANAVSLLMPHAEPYVVASTRAALGEGLVGDEHLCAQARAYAAQEARHHGQHRRLNRLLVTAHPRLGRVDAALARAFGFLRTRSTRFGLAFAAAFETIAFASARWVDDHIRLLRGAEPTATTLFLWHLAEEVEHKGVAHDVYRASGGGRLRYVAAMAVAAVVLAVGTWAGAWVMLVDQRRWWSPTAQLRLAGWSLSFVFAAMPIMAVSVLADHHPDQLTDPAGFDHWLDHLELPEARVPTWALP